MDTENEGGWPWELMWVMGGKGGTNATTTTKKNRNREAKDRSIVGEFVRFGGIRWGWGDLLILTFFYCSMLQNICELKFRDLRKLESIQLSCSNVKITG